MLSGACIGTNDIEGAAKFYDAVLATIGMTCVLSEPAERGYAGADGRIMLFATIDNLPHLGMERRSCSMLLHEATVRAFHNTAMKYGGQDEGLPGPRHYHPAYYGSYVRDLDGNKFNVSVSLEQNKE